MDNKPTFSFIIPVLNESGINDTIASLNRLFPNESFEVIVIDGDSSGSTSRLIQNPAVIKLCSERGRGKQMNIGAEAARGEILIFLHADTKLPPNALRLIEHTLSQSKYVAGAFRLTFDHPSWVFRLIETAASWRYLFTQLPYGDQTFFMSKTYFEQLGGYAEIPIMEDLDFMRRIKKRGDNICILKESITTSARRWEKEGVVYSVLRTWILASLFCLGVSPEKLVKHYRS